LVSSQKNKEVYFGFSFGFQHYCICYKQHRQSKNKNYHFDGKGEVVVRIESISKKGFPLAFFILSYSSLAHLVGQGLVVVVVIFSPSIAL